MAPKKSIKKKKEKKNVRVVGGPIESIQKHSRLPLFLHCSMRFFFVSFLGLLILFLWFGVQLSFSLVDLFVVIHPRILFAPLIEVDMQVPR
jgi:hypothetical protein